jgi:hypothetical protein
MNAFVLNFTDKARSRPRSGCATPEALRGKLGAAHPLQYLARSGRAAAQFSLLSLVAAIIDELGKAGSFAWQVAPRVLPERRADRTSRPARADVRAYSGISVAPAAGRGSIEHVISLPTRAPDGMFAADESPVGGYFS